MSTADGIVQHPSPNFTVRREGALPSLIVLHYTAMESPEAALERLCDAAAEVSAHYLICEKGQTFQMVEEEMRAWHAGAGRWGACTDVNSASIGIELANRGDHPFSEPQMAALEVLMAGIMARWSIPPEGVIAHSDMAPGRKCDPGPRFDWQRLARQGLSVWPEGQGEGDFWQDAAAFGYPVGDIDEACLLEAFRMRFRPGATGVLADEDKALIQALSRNWPVSTPLS